MIAVMPVTNIFAKTEIKTTSKTKTISSAIIQGTRQAVFSFLTIGSRIKASITAITTGTTTLAMSFANAPQIMIHKNSKRRNIPCIKLLCSVCIIFVSLGKIYLFFGSILSKPQIGRNTSGIVTEPSAFW